MIFHSTKISDIKKFNFFFLVYLEVYIYYLVHNSQIYFHICVCYRSLLYLYYSFIDRIKMFQQVYLSTFWN